MESNVVIRTEKIVKRFVGVSALENVYFTLTRREVYALVSENGAGNSSLMKILHGLFPATEGKIFMDARSTHIGSPIRAKKLGISMIH